jgi:hypothetical protein
MEEFTMIAAERKILSDSIRTTLKVRFPSTSFSTRVFRHGYWGATFGIRWVGGPSEDEVQQVTNTLKKAGVSIYYLREETT